jgi:3-oxoacyl-[acyl-carrier protein] reductase
MKTGLSGKIVFLSAATDGLGFAIARQAVLEGARVFIGSRSEEKVRIALEKLAPLGDASGIPLDMASGESIKDWVKAGLALFGGCDALLVNAGGPPPGNFESFGDDSAWQKAFELTLLSAVRLIRESLPALKASGHGSILTITSSAVKEPWPELILSGVMRSGVSSLVKSLSRELGHYGIRVNNIAPGKIMTSRLEKIIRSEAEARDIPYAVQLENTERDIPLGRIGTPDEFAQVAVFLLSDAAGYISGQTVLVDGGITKFLY